MRHNSDARSRRSFIFVPGLRPEMYPKVPKGSPKSAKGTQKGGQKEPRGRQNSYKNDNKSKLYLESGLECVKRASP